MVSEEIHHLEEIRHIATDVGHKTGRVDQVGGYKRQRCEMGWSQIIGTKNLSFLIKAVCDVLPTFFNLHAWGLTTSERCRAYGKTDHLNLFSRSYTWRHKEVLVIILEAAKTCCKTANKELNNIINKVIHFIKEGNISKLLRENKCSSLLLDGCTDWHIATNSEHHFVFQTKISLTTQLPDIIIWSVKLKNVFVC